MTTPAVTRSAPARLASVQAVSPVCAAAAARARGETGAAVGHVPYRLVLVIGMLLVAASVVVATTSAPTETMDASYVRLMRGMAMIKAFMVSIAAAVLWWLTITSRAAARGSGCTIGVARTGCVRQNRSAADSFLKPLLRWERNFNWGVESASRVGVEAGPPRAPAADRRATRSSPASVRGEWNRPTTTSALWDCCWGDSARSVLTERRRRQLPAHSHVATHYRAVVLAGM